MEGRGKARGSEVGVARERGRESKRLESGAEGGDHLALQFSVFERREDRSAARFRPSAQILLDLVDKPTSG